MTHLPGLSQQGVEGFPPGFENVLQPSNKPTAHISGFRWYVMFEMFATLIELNAHNLWHTLVSAFVWTLPIDLIGMLICRLTFGQAEDTVL